MCERRQLFLCWSHCANKWVGLTANLPEEVHIRIKMVIRMRMVLVIIESVSQCFSMKSQGLPKLPFELLRACF